MELLCISEERIPYLTERSKNLKEKTSRNRRREQSSVQAGPSRVSIHPLEEALELDWSFTICLCHLWFLSSVSYSFLSMGFLPASVQFSSVTQLCPTLCDPMNRSTPGLPVHHQLLDFTQTHVHRLGVMPSSHLILCRPLFLLPPIPPSIRVFSNESTLRMRWPKY